MTGQELAKEGAAMLPILLPDPSTRKAAAERIHKRAQAMMRCLLYTSPSPRDS